MESARESYQKMAAGGSLRRWKACKDMLRRWRAAGAPAHYKEDQDGKRILDLPARKERFSDLTNPASAVLRRLRGELIYKLQLKRLDK